MVVNSSVVASFKNAAVQASVQDGVLDLIIMKQCNVADLMIVTTELLAGKDISQRKEVIYRQASTFEVECSEELTSDIDGEVGPKLPLKIETVPQVLDIFY